MRASAGISLALLATVLLPGSRVLTQDASFDATLASQYIREAQALCSQDNDKLWGVSLCGPLLIVDRQTRLAVASQADKDGALRKAGDVFVGKYPSE